MIEGSGRLSDCCCRLTIVPFWDDLIDSPDQAIGLEIGCGRGRGTAVLADMFDPWRLDAIDSDQVDITKATKYLKPEYEGKVFVKAGKFSSIDATDEKYDLVFDFFNLHHTKNWRKGIFEISRVLKPGGYFAFGELWESKLKDYLAKNLLTKRGKKKFNREEFIKELAEHKLRFFEKNHRLWGHGILGVTRKIE